MDLDFMKIPSPTPLKKEAEDQPSSKHLGSSALELRWQPSSVSEKSYKLNQINAAGSIQKLVDLEQKKNSK